jgi:hypothetical protein
MTIFVHINDKKLMIFLSLYIEYLDSIFNFSVRKLKLNDKIRMYKEITRDANFVGACIYLCCCLKLSC